MIIFNPVSDYFLPPKQIGSRHFEVFSPVDFYIKPSDSYIVPLAFKAIKVNEEEPFGFVFRLDYSLTIKDNLSCINEDFFNIESKEDSICLYNHSISEYRTSFNQMFGERNTVKVRNGVRLGFLELT